MKRPLKIVVVTASILVAMYVAARLAGWIQLYEVPSLANYPAVKPGAYIFASNLKKPQRGDMILYISRYDGDPGKPPGSVFTHRLVAKTGDVLELRLGDLYINGRPADSGRVLMHNYRLPEQDAAPFLAALPEDIEMNVGRFEDGMVGVPIETSKATGLALYRSYLLPSDPDDFISRMWGHPWNRDNMGPFTIPAGKLFVLGDNRENSFDSRYAGFIDVKDVVGVRL